MKGYQRFTFFVVNHKIETHISIQFFTICRLSQQQMRATSQTDSRETIEALGVEFRPTGETLGDTISWLAQEGHIDRKLAGRLRA